MQTTNARKGLDLLTTRLDFTGQVVQSVAVHQGPSHAPVQVAEFFTYDHTGRLLTARQQLPGEAHPVLLDSVQYNEIGQAVRKTLGARAGCDRRWTTPTTSAAGLPASTTRTSPSLMTYST
ncbi:MAG: hypothetical protein ACRYFV_20480 [Janthinobacterium lividum]